MNLFEAMLDNINEFNQMPETASVRWIIKMGLPSPLIAAQRPSCWTLECVNGDFDPDDGSSWSVYHQSVYKHVKYKLHLHLPYQGMLYITILLTRALVSSERMEWAAS